MGGGLSVSDKDDGWRFLYYDGSNSDSYSTSDGSLTYWGVIDEIEKIYFVSISIFHFKFDCYGEALNFCVKWNIATSKITERQDCSVYTLTYGDYFEGII